MRLLLLLVMALALPTLALDNCVAVYDAATATHTARPTTLSRWFGRGEISGYPKPTVGGSVPSAWQADVKTRWDDGSAQMALISLRLDISSGGSTAICFVGDANRSSAGDSAATDAAALTQAQMLAYDTGDGAGSWSGAISATVNGIEKTASAATMLTAGSWSYWLRGPVVTQIVLEDRAGLSYDFGWTYSGSAWVDATGEQYKSLHPWFLLGFYPDPDGAGSLQAWGGVEVEAVLYNASTTRMQRIVLDDLRVKTGAGGATTSVSYCASGCTHTFNAANFNPRRSWHKVVWSGVEPAAVTVDFNLKYMISSRVIAPYDHSLRFDQAAEITTMLSAYDTAVAGKDPQFCEPSTAGTYRCGNWLSALGTTGARGDIALIPEWYLAYLYVMGSPATQATKNLVWNKLLLGNADAGASLPAHYFETDRTYRTGPGYGAKYYFNYPSDGTTPAIGRTISVNARSSAWLDARGQHGGSGVATEDAIVAVCSASPCDGRWIDYPPSVNVNGWGLDTAHLPSMFAVPYLLTGRLFYLRELHMVAGQNVLHFDRGYNIGRQTTFGLIHYYCNWRSHAWGVRELGWAAMLTPDGEPEKAYFERLVRNNDAAMEGHHSITDGLYPPANAACPGGETDSPWCTGRVRAKSLQAACYDNAVVFTDGVNTLGFPSAGGLWAAGTGGLSYTASRPHVSALMMHYTTIVHGWLNDVGAVRTGTQPVFSAVRQREAGFYAGLLTSPDVNPFSAWGKILPIGRMADRNWAQTWADYAAGHQTSYVLTNALTASDATITLNGANFMEDTSTGTLTMAPFLFEIEGEKILCTGRASIGSTTTGPFSGCRRGTWGTAAASHASGVAVAAKVYGNDLFASELKGGYPVHLRAVMALNRNVRPVSGAYSPARAYEWMSANLPKQDIYANNPMWALYPRSDPANVRAVAGAGALTLRYNAPDRAACTYTASASLADSSDASDTSDGGGPVARTVTVSGLSAGTARYRITCGAGRVIGTATIQ